MLKISDLAPSFSLPSTLGKKISLRDYRGKNVILYFYPKDSTPGCTREACDFQSNLSQLTNLDTIVLGVSPDGIDSHLRFQGKYHLNFPLLSDEKKEVARKYGVCKRKSLYGRTYMGIERSTFVIDKKGKIRHIFRKVKVQNHVDALVEILKTM